MLAVFVISGEGVVEKLIMESQVYSYQVVYTNGSSLWQMIETAGANGELTPLVLLVIRNRLELARHDVKSLS
jgi:hypothetical protein